MFPFVFLLFFSVSILAQEDRKVAVFDPAGTVDRTLIEIVREEISSVVVNRTGYTVLERQLINKVLEENRFQESGLVNDEQVSDIGKRMGADYVFVTTITTLGENYYISCKMIEVASARIDKQFTGTSIDGINDIPQTTQYIVRRLFGENVQQPVANRQRQQTNQPVQTVAPQRNETPASRPSIMPDVSSYGRLTTNGKNVFSSGKALRHAEIRDIMANTDALRYYNTGVRKLNGGRGMTATGFVFLGVGVIAEIGIAIDGYNEPGIASTVGVAGFCAFGIPGLVMKGTGKRNIRKAVEAYNSGVYGYSEPPPAFEIDFGITASGGIGFVMRF